MNMTNGIKLNMKKIFTKIYDYFFNSLPKPCEPKTLLDIHVQELRDALYKKLYCKKHPDRINKSTTTIDNNIQCDCYFCVRKKN